MKKRASVKKLIIHLRYPDGLIEQQVLDGESAEAIVNSDRGATEILAPFYNNRERHLKTAELVKRFGPHVTALTGNKEETPITPGLVKKLWSLKNEDGLLPAFMMKLPDCTFGSADLQPVISAPQPGADPRPQIIRVSLQMLYPDGKPANTILKAGEFEGIFWSDRAAIEILAPFYNTTERWLTRDEIIALCGPAVTSITGNKKEIAITPGLVADLWELKDDGGFLPAFIIKMPECPLRLEYHPSAANANRLSWRKAA